MDLRTAQRETRKENSTYRQRNTVTVCYLTFKKLFKTAKSTNCYWEREENSTYTPNNTVNVNYRTFNKNTKKNITYKKPYVLVSGKIKGGL